jgi:thiamine biosynthesis lipoprotein
VHADPLIRSLFWILPAISLASCDRPVAGQPGYELSGATMGTTFSVQVVAPPDGVRKDLLQEQVVERLAAIEKSMSTYDPASELSRFNAQTGTNWISVSAELCNVVVAAQRITVLSDGAFDITVGPLVNLWGFGPEIRPDEVPDSERVAAVIQSTGNRHLRTDCSQPALAKALPALYVDLSAYAKGYGVDRVAALLSDAGIRNYLVEIGGELRAAGTNAKNRPWSVAIEAPNRDSRTVARVVGLTDMAMATSGDYRNFFEYAGRFYSHTIDPRSGFPVAHDAAAVTVVAESAALADGMATALLVLGPGDGLQLAERLDLAALFQVRTATRVQERMSSRFAREVALL